MQEAIEFLIKVWTEQAEEGDARYFFLATKSKGKTWKDHALKWPVTSAKLEEFFERYDTDDYNLYFCPHGFTSPDRRKESAASTVFLWADLDNAKPEQCKPVPQIAWQSSPGRYAALWRLNKARERDEVEDVNKALSYANGADKGGWDFTQVLRIPGTRNHKYKDAPKGKLRWFKTNSYGLDDFPDLPEESELDPISTLKKVRQKVKSDTYRLLTARHAQRGTRSEMIWKLENDLAEQGLSRSEIFTLIKHSVWNKFSGRRDEDDQLRRELSKVHSKQERPSIAGAASERTPSRLVRLSDVEPEQVDWLWWPYIPLGKITMLEGDPGLGKSWITMALCSYVSLKKRFPGQEEPPHGGRVLLMSAEDGLGDTIRPRLDTMKADVSRIFSIPDPVTFDEEGCVEIEQHIEDVKPGLIIIDPLVAYMGGQVDLHKANETREVMARLARIAERHKVAILCVRHLTKGGRDKSIYRGIGSIDITAAARSVLIVGRNPDNPDEGRVLVHIKSNLAPLGPSQAYVLRPKSARPFQFEGPVTFTAEEVFKAEATGGDGEWAQVCKWLEQRLKDGPMYADDVRRDGEAKGYAKKLINQAKREMKVVVTVKNDRVVWEWPT